MDVYVGITLSRSPFTCQQCTRGCLITVSMFCGVSVTKMTRPARSLTRGLCVCAHADQYRTQWISSPVEFKRSETMPNADHLEFCETRCVWSSVLHPALQSTTMSNAGSTEPITITLVLSATGQSESIPVQPTQTSVTELTEWASALFGIESAQSITLHKDGIPLVASSTTLSTTMLHQTGVIHGDVIAVVSTNHSVEAMAAPRPAAAAPQAGFLDFSNLLGQADVSPAAVSANMSAGGGAIPEPVYYSGMTLDDAMQYNPHPTALVSLLRTHDHLFKEFHYHDPILSSQIRDPSLTVEQAADVYRSEMVKVGETILQF
jgi:hypothetical protein